MEDSVGTRPESVVNRRGSWGWGPPFRVVAAKAPIWGSPRGLCWFLKKSSILYHLIVSATRFPFFPATTTAMTTATTAIHFSYTDRGMRIGRNVSGSIRSARARRGQRSCARGEEKHVWEAQLRPCPWSWEAGGAWEGEREGDLAAWAAERTMKRRHIDTLRPGLVHTGLGATAVVVVVVACPRRSGADHQPFRATTGADSSPSSPRWLGRSDSRALASLAGAVRAAEAGLPRRGSEPTTASDFKGKGKNTRAPH